MGRFDLAFKTVAENQPRVIVEKFGCRPIDDSSMLTHVEREVAAPLTSMDHAYLVERGGERWIEHFEAEIRLTEEDRRAIPRKGLILAAVKWLPVWTTILLLSRKDGAKAAPISVEPDELGSYRLMKDIRLLRLWEMDPALVLSGETVMDLVPMVGGMARSWEAMEEAMRRLAAVRDGEARVRLNAEFVTWSSLNYNEDVLTEIRGRLSTMVTGRDLLMASPLGEQILREGLEQGREEGVRIALRESTMEIVDRFFPGLLTLLQIEPLDSKTLADLQRRLIRAQSRTEAEEAVHQLLR